MIVKKRHLKGYNEGAESPGITGSQVDKLSKVLEAAAFALDEGLKREEELLRPQLIEGFALYGDSRINLGRSLHHLRAIFKPQRIWVILAEQLGDAIGREKRTIFRLIAEYETSLMPPIEKAKLMPVFEATDPNEEGEEEVQSEEEVLFLETCLHVQKAAAPYPDAQKVDMLLHAIEVLGFGWGMSAKTVHLAPHAPSILIRDSGHGHCSPMTHLNAAQIIPWPNEAPANGLVD